MGFLFVLSVKDMLLWIYWYPLRILIQKMPSSLMCFLTRISGRLLYHFLPRKRKALEKELYGILGAGLDSKDVKAAVLRAFINLCQSEAEMMLFPKLNEGNIDKFIDSQDFKNLEDGLSNGKGVMLLFAHFGANQMVMPAIGYRGYTMSQMSAPSTIWEEKIPNRKISRIAKLGLEIRWKHEQSLPVKHINIFGSMKEAFLCLKRNEILGIAMDGGGGDKRVSVDFLGKRAFFATGAIGVAMRTNCAVLPTFMIRNPDGTNRMIIEPQMKMKSLDESPAAIEENTAVFVKRLEEYVIRYPCHYLNFLALRTYMEMQGDLPFMVNRNPENN